MPIKEAQEHIEKHSLETDLKVTTEALGELQQTPEQVQRWGHYAEQICQHAAENEVDLIVVGARGRSAFNKLLLGGVSSQVVNHAQCPVTVVH